MLRPRNIISLVAFVLAVSILAYLVWDIRTPLPVIVEDRVGDATVLFRSDTDTKMLAADCVSVSWQVEQFEAVYLITETKGSESKAASGTEQICFQVLHPTLEVHFLDGTIQQYTLPISIFSQSSGLIGVLVVPTLLFITFLTSTLSPILRSANRFRYRVRMHLREVHVTPEQLRLARIMGYVFSFLNAISVITLLLIGNFSPTMLTHLLLAGAGTIVSLIPRSHRFLAHFIQLRWVILLPFVWFMIMIYVLDWIQLDLAPHSAIRTWYVTLFFWLITFWLISYAMRSFTFDRPRRFAWASIAGLFVAVALFSLTAPPLVDNYDRTVERDVPPSNLLYHYAQFNSDSINYVYSAQNFPTNWRYTWIIHRPTFIAMASQVCLLIDIPLHGYAAPTDGCSSDTTVVPAMWLVNFGMGLISLLILYELVRIFLDNAYVAWLAAMFATLSPFHLWTLAVPSTDYAEIFIFHLTLWLIYRLFSEPNDSFTRIFTFGFILGLLLLIKFNVILYFFALTLIVVFRRIRFLLVWTVLPFTVFVAYTQLISTWDIPYKTVETQGRWSTMRWIFLEFIYFSPQRMWRTLAEWGGYTAYQVILLFGVLFVIAVFALSFDRKASRTVVPLGWLMFFSSAAFAFIARISYTGHILQLMPVIYGGAALGIWQLQTALEQRYPKRLWLARTAGLVLIAAVILHILLQWFVFGTHSSRSIVVLLSPDIVSP
jgi:hypothetical protein